MNVVILDTRPVRRGAQIFVQALATWLRTRDIQVSVLYLYRNRDTVSLPLHDSDQVLGFDENHFLEKWLTLQPLLVWKLAGVLKNLKPDCILLNGSRNLKYGAAVKKFLPEDTRLIYRSIDSASFWNPGGIKKWYYQNFVMPAMDGVVGVSQASLRDTVSAYHFKVPSVAIPRAIDVAVADRAPSRTEARRHLRISEEAFVVLFLGRMIRQKRPDRFVEVIEQLHNKYQSGNFFGLMVGDGPLMTEVGALVDQKGLGGVLKLAGAQTEVWPFIAASDVLVLTSDTEGLPGVVLEAALLHVPSVASEVGGVRECIEEGHTGFIVSSADVDQYVARLRFLQKQKEQRLEMGKQARHKIIQSFSLDAIGPGYLNFFSVLLQSRKTG